MWSSVTLALATALGALGDDAPRPPAVLFVGMDDAAERTAAFARFLRERFDTVAVTTHSGLSPEHVAAAGVVLLDWQQGSAEFPPQGSPLGAREDWARPTVLLGSAGLFTACAWEALGGSG